MIRLDSVAVIDGDVCMSSFTQRPTDDVKSAVAASWVLPWAGQHATI